MKIIYIGIGSNLNDPIMQVREALDRLQDIPGVFLKKCSSLYKSDPMGPQDQPDFINAVAEMETNLSAEALLSFLQRVEAIQQRDCSGQHWGPRTIDLDILLFGDEVIKTHDLTIPHYGLKNREFVVYPLAEIAPHLVLPSGESISELIAQCPKRNLQLLELIEEVQ